MEDLPDINQDSIESKQGESNDEVSDPSRRNFLKLAGFVSLSALLAACAPDKALDVAEKDVNKQKNTEELNSQFQVRSAEFLDERGVFNYERYSNIYPEFEQYIPAINRYSQEIRKFYDIDSGVMMALASSILVANVGREPDTDVEHKFQRVGPMGMIPNTALPVINKSFNEQYTSEYLEHPENSIYFTMIYMAETLKDIRNDGENRDMMSLMLANYYGGTLLQDIIKGKNSIESNQGLKDSYNLYSKTVSVLNNRPISTEHVSIDSDIELELKEVLIRAQDMWFKSKFGEFAKVFAQQVDEYYNQAKVRNPYIRKSELLSVVIAIARAESKGGIYKEIENPPSNFKKEDLAVGWYQIVPKWKHLESFNTQKDKNYTYEDMVTDDRASIEVGIWTLMQYSDSMDMSELMKKFKGGWNFGDMYNQPDDTLWWNRVSYGIKSLLGYNPFKMQYLHYLYPKQVRNAEGNIVDTVWEGPFDGSTFESSNHIGVMNPDLSETV